MNKICTSIDQSQKLIELGIDVNTADMCHRYRWSNNSFMNLPCAEKAREPITGDIPAWSLSALLGLIPPGNILLRDALNGKYKCINMVDSSYYDNPLDAAFEMVCWLKENEKL